MRQFWRIVYPILIDYAVTVAAAVIFFTPNVMLNLLLTALMDIPILGYFFRKDQTGRDKSLFAGGLSWKMTAYIILLGMAACLAVNNLISISRLGERFPGYSEASAELYASPLWLQIIAVGLFVPVKEELIFRGLIFARLRDRQGFWIAAMISSLIFGIYHGNVVQFLYAWFMGLLMCWIYEQSGSFLGAVVFHQAANLFSVMATEIFKLDEGFSRGMSFYMITAGALAAGLLMIREIKRVKIQSVKNEHTQGGY